MGQAEKCAADAFVGVYQFLVYVCLVDVDAGTVVGKGGVDKGGELFDAYAPKGGSRIANVLNPVWGKVLRHDDHG